jgi:hypothetical protein
MSLMCYYVVPNWLPPAQSESHLNTTKHAKRNILEKLCSNPFYFKGHTVSLLMFELETFISNIQI